MVLDMTEKNQTILESLPLLRDNCFGDQATNISDASAHVKNMLLRYDGRTLNEWSGLGVTVYPALPSSGEARNDESHKLSFFTLRPNHPEKSTETWIDTHNCMGVVQLRDKEKGHAVLIAIGSRFDNHENQLFLTYLLSKVFGGSIVDLGAFGPHSLWDILLAFVFRRRLLEANGVGLFKHYMTFHHNDIRVRGRIDVNEHLRRNIPFLGKVAYDTHEISFDNPTNHLIRYALVKVRQKWGGLLAEDNRVTEMRHQLEQNTPTWNPRDVMQCIRCKENQSPIKHPYFGAHYEPLRKVSLALLRDEGASLYQQQQEAEGVIFDGSWLWEEYLWTLLKNLKGFEHLENKKEEEGWKTGLGFRVVPDFFHKSKRVILDAKYKRQRVSQDDAKQVFAYMFLLDAVHGGLIKPDGDDDENRITIYRQFHEAEREERKAWWHNFVLKPPSDASTAEEFLNKMGEKEKKFTNAVWNKVILGSAM
jgi:5-methylcytosine-specific restriction endonuclease McrBC regulatory subunit McrC